MNEWKGVRFEAMVVLGYAIHSLRASLDPLTSELAHINCKSDNHVYFPIAASKQDFPKSIEKRNIDKAVLDAVNLIHTYASYRGGNELLRAVHNLDIEDKHTALLETHKTIDFELDATLDTSHRENESKLVFETGPIQHRFSKNSPLPERPVIETLRVIQQDVSRVAEAFRDFDLNQTKNTKNSRLFKNKANPNSIIQSPSSLKLACSSGLRPSGQKNLRSDSLIGKSLMLA